MATKLVPQVAGSTLLVTPTTNSADTTGNYVKPAEVGIKSLVLRFANTGGSPNTVTIDDPTSVAPPGAGVVFTPDVFVAVPATTGVRTFLIPDVTRFTDPATGQLNWTYSGAFTGTVEAYGF
jgi:hypothetical protein